MGNISELSDGSISAIKQLTAALNPFVKLYIEAESALATATDLAAWKPVLTMPVSRYSVDMVVDLVKLADIAAREDIIRARSIKGSLLASISSVSDLEILLSITQASAARFMALLRNLSLGRIRDPLSMGVEQFSHYLSLNGQFALSQFVAAHNQTSDSFALLSPDIISHETKIAPEVVEGVKLSIAMLQKPAL